MEDEDNELVDTLQKIGWLLEMINISLSNKAKFNLNVINSKIDDKMIVNVFIGCDDGFCVRLKEYFDVDTFCDKDQVKLLNMAAQYMISSMALQKPTAESDRIGKHGELVINFYDFKERILNDNISTLF